MDNQDIIEKNRTKNSELLSYLSSRDFDMNDVISMFFLGYISKYRDGYSDLANNNDHLPQNLIKIYYSNITSPRFNLMWNNFKTEYINNENDLENVHSTEEREGLGIVYDYITSKDNYEHIDIYQLLKIHQYLFSKCPYPEFGGNFRTEEIYLPNSGVETCDWRMIPNEMAKLYQPTNELIKEGLKLGKRRNPSKIIEYIDNCLNLNCTIIKMHPFSDGNGRSVRAFTNMLFRIANIPPIYVKAAEKDVYGRTINKAIVQGDNSDFRRFYYYKICDSIVELDILKRSTFKSSVTNKGKSK